MTFPRITQTFVEKELYKLCAGSIIRRILGQYSSRSTWQPQDIIKRLIQACVEQTSVEDICSTSAGPSADRVHQRLAGHQLAQLERLVNEWLIEIASRQDFHPQTKITVAIDFHHQPFYGKRELDWVTGMKPKKGTFHAITFLLVSLTTGTQRCPLTVRLITRPLLKRKAQLIDQILAELTTWLPIKRVLLDRGFCEAGIIQVLEARGLEYLIAAKRHGLVKTAAVEIQACVAAHARQAGVDITDSIRLGQWARKQGLDQFRVRYVSLGYQSTPVELVAVLVRLRTHHRDPLKRWTYRWFLYLTNCPLTPRVIVRLYGKRWMIETDIRCIAEFKAVTNSTQPQVRFLLYGLAMVLDALWTVCSLLLNRLRSHGPFPITEETRFRVKQSDAILIIARAFKRYVRTKILPELRFPGGDA